MQASTPQFFDLENQHKNNVELFKKALTTSRFWQLTEKSNAKNLGFYDTETGLINSSLEEFEIFLNQYPFLYLKDQSNKKIATLETASQLLWSNALSDQYYYLSNAKIKIKEFNQSGLKDWKLPFKKQFKSFATSNNNPYRVGEEYKLQSLDKKAIKREVYNIKDINTSIGDLIVSRLQRGYVENIITTDDLNAKGTTSLWLISEGLYNTNEDSCEVKSNSTGYIFACNEHWKNKHTEGIFSDLAANQWQLISPDGDFLQTDDSFKSDSLEQLQAKFVLKNIVLTSIKDPSKKLDPSEFWIDEQLIDLDYTPCRLPKLDTSQLTDPAKGLWELWGQDTATLQRLGYVPRDPFKDVQRYAIAIDFGTSSTVVAMDTSSGGQELLRIGVRDFFQAVEAKQFENPTILECLDFSAFKKVWQSQVYRPRLNWDWMRASHEAQTSFRDNPGDTAILACMIPRLKQWALRSAEDNLLRITGRQGVEVVIPHHIERNPIRGQPIEVNADDIFDPIEVYAWYLGMAINWRGRGVFLNYHLSFPVKYPLEVKNSILASFRRGLQRSLPASLIEHYPQVLNEFAVNDLASEPAAYAASALQYLKVEPTDKGIIYAVFDFGGGTSDFDFGVLRWATDEEEDQGYDRVFEHLASSGDNFLGGENLLEHLVYESFKSNLDELRKDRIQFTRPIDAEAFAGSEAFIAATQAAQTNTIILAAKLRTFMEGAALQLDSQLKLDLLDVNGEKKLCILNLNLEALDYLLAERIKRGVQTFLAELARVISKLTNKQAAGPIHFLLAGNGNHSRHIQALCNIEAKEWQTLCSQAFGDSTPEIIIYPPLPLDESKPHAPTAKTGVALGLLQVSPGKNTLLLNKLVEQQGGQAPFSWYVGRMRRNVFKPIIEPQAAYGEWFDLGPLQASVFNLLTSTSPRAATGLALGDPELTMHSLAFPVAPATGARLYVRITAPNQLEYTATSQVDELENSQLQKLQLG